MGFTEWKQNFFAPRSRLPKGWKITFLSLEVLFGLVGIALVIYGSVNQLQSPITTTVQVQEVRRHDAPPLIVCGSQGVFAGLQSNSSTPQPGAEFALRLAFFVEESNKIRTPYTVVTENVVFDRALLNGAAAAVAFPSGTVNSFVGSTTMVLQDTAPCFNVSSLILPDVATGSDGRIRVAIGFSQTLVHAGLAGEPAAGLIKTFGAEDVIAYWDYDLTPTSDLDSASMKSLLQGNSITQLSVDEERYITIDGKETRKLRSETNYGRWFSDFSFAGNPSPSTPMVNQSNPASYYSSYSTSYGVVLQWKSNTVLVTKEQRSVDPFLLVGVFLSAVGSGILIIHAVFEYIMVRQKKEISRRSERDLKALDTIPR